MKLFKKKKPIQDEELEEKIEHALNFDDKLRRNRMLESLSEYAWKMFEINYRANGGQYDEESRYYRRLYSKLQEELLKEN